MNLFSKKGLLKMNYNLNPLLQNRMVLYFFFFLAIADLFYLANLRDFTTVTIIVLTGFLTSFFSKNMIVILCVALSVGHVMKYGTGNVTRREGAKTMADSSDEISGDSTSSNDDISGDSSSLKAKGTVGSKGKHSDEKKKAKDDLMEGLKEFQSVQGDLVNGIQKLQPMLSKAESFIEKYETYKNMK
jgi:hypothetical protein